MNHHDPVHNRASAAAAGPRIGNVAAWGLNLLFGLGILALVGGVVTVRVQTDRVAAPHRAVVLEARTLALQEELTQLDRSMDAVFHGLMEARGISSRARALVGLGHGAGASGGEILPAVAGDDDSILGRTMNASTAQVNENLREARRLRDSFREIVAGMESQSEVWARIPSTPPITNARLSSDYGLRRDPFTRRLTWHRGLDLAAPRGTPVRASAEGRVTRAGRYSGYGLLIEIDHENGIRTRYAHNSRLTVHTGDLVRRGSVISYVGSTGRASAAHLHYEVLINGEAVNPEPYLLTDTFFAD